jgi:hypothetical protein
MGLYISGHLRYRPGTQDAIEDGSGIRWRSMAATSFEEQARASPRGEASTASDYVPTTVWQDIRREVQCHDFLLPIRHDLLYHTEHVLQGVDLCSSC